MYVSNIHFLFPNANDVSKRHSFQCMFPIYMEPSTQDILIKMKFIQIIFRDQDNLILRVPKGYITFDPDLIKIIKMNFVFHKSAQT